ncbi:MAG: NAD(+)/NADH kinase, partial [Bacteroidales bacterium]|nr:NAD(+)/NADH kinase [Bacteroidales bacterium]
MRIALYSTNVSRDDSRLKLLEKGLAEKHAEVVWADGPESLKGVDMVLSIGGDGTFLRLITAMRGSDVPVAGINFGHLGFLTTATMDKAA